LEKGPGLLEPIEMNNEEIANVFNGGVIIILLQLSMIGLIMMYEIYSPDFEIVPSDSFSIILARLFASMMMHLNVEPEIRAGLKLAKYCVNHPSRFRGAVSVGEDGKEHINISAVFPPFFLAMSQAIVGLIVEFNVLVYLTSLKKLLEVIMKFVTLAAICKFDDMYASALQDNKMQAAGGKKLRCYYFRRFSYMLED
jgi:hypothetical protein